MGSIPAWGGKIPPASRQLTLHTAPTEPVGPQPESVQQKVPCEATKPGHSQINKDEDEEQGTCPLESQHPYAHALTVLLYT